MGRNLGVYKNYWRYGGGCTKKIAPQEGVDFSHKLVSVGGGGLRKKV